MFVGEERRDLSAVADDLDEDEAVGGLDHTLGAGDVSTDVARERVEQRVDPGAVERPVDRDRVGLVQVEQRRTRDPRGIAGAMSPEGEEATERTWLAPCGVHERDAGSEFVQAGSGGNDGRRHRRGRSSSTPTDLPR